MLDFRFGFWVIIALLAGSLTGCGKNKSLVSEPIASEPVGSVVEQMLIASGLNHFDQVTKIQFTFNVRKRANTLQRKWIWHPKEDKVTLTYTDADGQEQILSYIRSDVVSNPNAKQNLMMADRWFINDSFWLLLPLHLSWQNPQDVTVVDQGMANAPLGQSTARHIIVTFNSGGGYTPGDVYELFLNDQNLITQWIFRRAGSEKPTLINTFEKYTSVGPCRLALNHKNPSGFKLWFTQVKIVTDH